jgi:Fe-S oxidoreductase
VLHYTQFLVEHLDRLTALMVHPVARRVTYHDPCYLSRHNGEYEAPRRLLAAIPGVTLTEMPRSRENGYCCGGGGGGMWLDSFSRDHTSMRLSDRRVIEAAETGAGTLAICCPYEVSRFEDAVKATGHEGRLDVRDIAELVDQAMRGPAAP